MFAIYAAFADGKNDLFLKDAILGKSNSHIHIFRNYWNLEKKLGNSSRYLYFRCINLI